MGIPVQRWIQNANHRRKRLVAHARRYGRDRAVSLLLHRVALLPLIRVGFQWHLLEVFTVQANQLKVPKRVPSNYQIRIAGQADQPALEEYFGDANRVRQRLERGDLCLIACCREEIGAAVWFLPGPASYGDDCQEIGCRFELPEGAVWSYDGKGTKFGAWGCLMAKLPEYLERWGVDHVFTAIDYHNGESLSGHQSLGYRRLGMLRRVMLSGLSRTVCKRSGDGWGQLPVAWDRLQLSR